MDYFDCDYFDPTYFDTPDCDAPVAAVGRHAVGPAPRIPELDEADELMAVI